MDIRKSEHGVRCVIYDCDGVLFDSLEANGRLYSDVCVSLGRPPLSPEELRYVHCHTVSEAIRLISQSDPNLEEKARSILKQIDLKKYVRFLKMEPHLLDALRELKKKGILRAVDTNRTTSMPYVMDDFKLQPYFEMVVTALDVKNPKPHPESVEKILRAFSLKKEEALFVGDSDVDQGTARASGVRFVAYKNRDIADGLYIEDHLDLLKNI
jgi:HAD superfamily hydrolase (TIGR01509 family)